MTGKPYQSSFDRLLAAVAPGLAARRLLSRARLANVERLYEAVTASNYRPRRGSMASADLVMENAKGRLREYGRWLDENSDLAVGVLDDLVSNVVGVGVGVEPMVLTRRHQPLQSANDQLRDLWHEFWRRPEVTGEIPGPELERLVCRSWLRDGEVFVRHIGAAAPRAPLGYLLAPLESDYVPWDYVEPREAVTHGIRKDEYGRPLAYYVYRQHPGNLGITGMFSPSVETIQVPADEMTHLKFVRRLHQTRGASVLHACLERLDDIKDYEASERIAARFAAAITAFIKKPEFAAGAGSGLVDDNQDRAFDMAPGTIFDGLLPGEDVGMIDSKRPNNDIANFIAIQERRIAAGSGSRYSSVSRNYNGTYSAQRQELVEGAVHYRRLFSYLAAQFYMPVWERFITAAVLSGRFRVPRSADPRSVFRPQLRAPSLPWIDPLKEVEAYSKAVEQGFRARQQVIRDMGGDPREVDALLAVDEFDVRPANSAQPAPPAPGVDESAQEQQQDEAA